MKKKSSWKNSLFGLFSAVLFFLIMWKVLDFIETIEEEKKIEVHNAFMSADISNVLVDTHNGCFSIEDEDLKVQIINIIRNVHVIENKAAGSSTIMFRLFLESENEKYRIAIFKDIDDEIFFVSHPFGFSYFASDNENFLDQFFKDFIVEVRNGSKIDDERIKILEVSKN